MEKVRVQAKSPTADRDGTFGRQRRAARGMLFEIWAQGTPFGNGTAIGTRNPERLIIGGNRLAPFAWPSVCCVAKYARQP